MSVKEVSPKPFISEAEKILNDRKMEERAREMLQLSNRYNPQDKVVQEHTEIIEEIPSVLVSNLSVLFIHFYY